MSPRLSEATEKFERFFFIFAPLAPDLKGNAPRAADRIDFLNNSYII